ncbi:UNVERIFIED_CONTAM: hypothetical protein NCL1_28265 [Trichonephila clavipes]
MPQFSHDLHTAIRNQVSRSTFARKLDAFLKTCYAHKTAISLGRSRKSNCTSPLSSKNHQGTKNSLAAGMGSTATDTPQLPPVQSAVTLCDLSVSEKPYPIIDSFSDRYHNVGFGHPYTMSFTDNQAWTKLLLKELSLEVPKN